MAKQLHQIEDIQEFFSTCVINALLDRRAFLTVMILHSTEPPVGKTTYISNDLIQSLVNDDANTLANQVI